MHTFRCTYVFKIIHSALLSQLACQRSCLETHQPCKARSRNQQEYVYVCAYVCMYVCMLKCFYALLQTVANAVSHSAGRKYALQQLQQLHVRQPRSLFEWRHRYIHTYCIEHNSSYTSRPPTHNFLH